LRLNTDDKSADNVSSVTRDLRNETRHADNYKDKLNKYSVLNVNRNALVYNRTTYKLVYRNDNRIKQQFNKLT